MKFKRSLGVAAVLLLLAALALPCQAQTADLQVVKTSPTASPQAGATATFLIQVYNHGPNDATGVVVTDVLPAQLNPVQAFASDSGVVNVTGQTLTVTFDTIGAFQSRIIAFNAFVDPNAPNGLNVCDTATVTALTPDFNPTNNTSSFCLCVKNGPCGCGLVFFSEIFTGNLIPVPGQTGIYNVEIIGRACRNLYGLTIQGQLAGIIGATSNMGTIRTTGSLAFRNVSLTIPFLAAGQSINLMLQVQVSIPKNCPIPPTAQTGPFMILPPFSASFFSSGLRCTTFTDPLFVNVICPTPVPQI